MNKNSLDSATVEFLAEGNEIVERMSLSLQALEKNKGCSTPSEIGSLYRDMHTLKGSALLFGFKQIAIVAHTMEACLDPLRKSTVPIPLDLIEHCLVNVDLLERMLKEALNGKTELCEEEELTRVVSLLIEKATESFHASAEVSSTIFSASNSDLEKSSKNNIKIDQNPENVDPQRGIMNTASSVESELTSQGKITLPSNSIIPSTTETQTTAVQADSTVRVHVHLLDRILNLVGELVLVRNQLLQYRQKLEEPEFLSTTKNLDVVTSELQSEVMKTRMQPIESVVGKYLRVVRDISNDMKKKIDITIQGSETELDRTLIEAIKDPLTHIVRNSCDHGIETPEERKIIGKPETGHLLIRAFHEGGASCN